MPSRKDAGDLRKRLASGLRRERVRRGWTQEQSAEAAQLNVRHFQKLEEGSVNVTLSTIGKLSAGLGVDIRKLFEN